MLGVKEVCTGLAGIILGYWVGLASFEMPEDPPQAEKWMELRRSCPGGYVLGTPEHPIRSNGLRIVGAVCVIEGDDEWESGPR